MTMHFFKSGLVAVFEIGITPMAFAEANINKVRDIHMLALMAPHCEFGFDDKRAAVLASTYSQEEGGVSAAETQQAIGEADKLVSDAIRLKQTAQMCNFGKIFLNRIGQKWLTFARGG